jgi:4-hydroxybenzoyl-CoA thioesterase/acyl-CoA thioester hydrolase
MDFQTTRRVEFRDTDAAGIVHFSAFFPMMESAEHEMLRSLGLGVMQPEETDAANRSEGAHAGEEAAFPASAGMITWPRVAAACDYHGAARFEDILQIAVGIEQLGKKSVRYRIRISRDGEPIASGTITTVCCRLRGGGQLQSIPIPEKIRKLLSPLVIASNN